MRIIFYFIFSAGLTLISKTPTVALIGSLILSALVGRPIEAIAGLSGVTLASILKDKDQRTQTQMIVLASSLYAGVLFFTQSIFQDLVAGFAIVFAIKGCFVL